MGLSTTPDNHITHGSQHLPCSALSTLAPVLCCASARGRGRGCSHRLDPTLLLPSLRASGGKVDVGVRWEGGRGPSDGPWARTGACGIAYNTPQITTRTEIWSWSVAGKSFLHGVSVSMGWRWVRPSPPGRVGSAGCSIRAAPAAAAICVGGGASPRCRRAPSLPVRYPWQGGAGIIVGEYVACHSCWASIVFPPNLSLGPPPSAPNWRGAEPANLLFPPFSGKSTGVA